MNSPFVAGSLALGILATTFTVGETVVFIIEPSPISFVVVIGMFVVEILTLDNITWYVSVVIS